MGSKYLVVNRNGCSFNAGVYGPLFTHLNYSLNTGLSIGALGISVNEDGETSFRGLEIYLAERLGKHMKKAYYSSFENEGTREKDLGNSKAEKQEAKSKINERDGYQSSSAHMTVRQQSDFKKFKQSEISRASKETTKTEENYPRNVSAVQIGELKCTNFTAKNITCTRVQYNKITNQSDSHHYDQGETSVDQGHTSVSDKDKVKALITC
jgi:hypothetical protein